MFGSNNVNDRSSGKNGDNHLILDTGATHHMTGRVELMRDIREIFSTGHHFVTPKLCLKNVYLVPRFDINLIIFGQLVSDNNLVGHIIDLLLIL